MRHGDAHRRFNMPKSQRRALFANLTNALLTHEQITITLPRAKELRTFAESMITYAKKGEVHYDFVEIMSCPGGCINGGGQPYKEDAVMVEERRHVLYGLDKRDNLRFSHENPSVKQCYEEYFEKPLSHRAHEILHV